MKIRGRLVIVLALALTIGVASVAAASYYPANGNLTYSGQTYANSYFAWTSSGGWVTEQGGYEHSLKLQDYYFNSCTAYTNLPNGYDDCPTAGIDDPAGHKIYSFGSFSLKNNLTLNYYYFGSWQWSGGSGNGSSSTMSLRGKEVAATWCPFWNIWCMGASQATEPPLVSGSFFKNSGTQGFTWYGR